MTALPSAPLSVSTAEAGLMLRRTSQHVRTLIKQGKLQAVYEGRSMRVLVSSIRRYAGEEDDGHEAVSSRPDVEQRERVRQLRRWLAEGQRLLAEWEG